MIWVHSFNYKCNLNTSIYILQINSSRVKFNSIQQTAEVSTFSNPEILPNVDSFNECPLVIHKTLLKIVYFFITIFLTTYDSIYTSIT